MKSDRQLLENHFAYTPQDLENQENSEDEFVFVGEVNTLPRKVEKLSPERLSKIRKGHIIIAGVPIKQGSQYCKCMTCICGCALCFPFLFTCCQWWKKMTSNSFEVPLGTYRLLSSFIESSKLYKLTLVVQDNALGVQKANTLIQSIEKSKVKELKIINLAGEFSLNEEDCYGQFQNNFSHLQRSNQRKTYIKWASNIQPEALV